MRGDVAFSALLERDRLGCIEPLPRPLSASCVDRVYPLVPLAARVQRLRAGFLQAIQRDRTKPHTAGPAIEHVTQHPVLRAFGRDAQIEPAAIGVHAGYFRLLNLYGRKSPYRSCHGKFFLRIMKHQLCPQLSTELWRRTANGCEGLTR